MTVVASPPMLSVIQVEVQSRFWISPDEYRYTAANSQYTTKPNNSTNDDSGYSTTVGVACRDATPDGGIPCSGVSLASRRVGKPPTTPSGWKQGERRFK